MIGLSTLASLLPTILEKIFGKKAGGVVLTKGLMRSKMVWYIAASTAVKSAITDLPVGDDTKAWMQFVFVLVDFAAIVYLRAVTKESI